MSVNKTWNGVTYSIPNTRSESGWESTLSSYLQALADNAATTTFNKQAVRKATTTPVTVSASTDCTIIVDLTGPGASTVNLPAGADKQIFIIVDGKGDASTNNITIDANGSETIEGSLTKVIRLNRECLVLQYSSSAGDWKVIGGYVPNMVGGPASATSGRVAVYNGTTGKLLQDGTKLEADLVVGPASATDNAIVRFDGATGKLIKNTPQVTVDDNGVIRMTATVGNPIYTRYSQTANSGKVWRAGHTGAVGGFTGYDIYNETDGIVAFTAASTGAVTLGPSASTATNCVVNGAASVTHGVVFPASQNAVANANTLDDYEEGTFTPTLTASVTNPTNYGQNGRYTKIGNLVHVEVYITFDGTSTFGSGDYTISGLPFATAATHIVTGWGTLFKSGSGWYEVTMEIPPGGSGNKLIYTQTNTYVTQANPNTWNSGSYFKYQFTYRVA